MSTKIYDAYRVNTKDTSLAGICAAAEEMKNAAHKTALNTVMEDMIRFAVTAMDIKSVLGNKKLDEIVQMAEAKPKHAAPRDISRWKHRANVFRAAKDAETIFDMPFFDLMALSMTKRKEEIPVYSTLMASAYFYQYEDRIFTMLFGSADIINAVVSETETDMLSDWHFQNQTDRPEGISEEEWNAREKSWDKMIGPDYIPARHGVKVELTDFDRIEEELL